jgi:hypothetical protein
MSKTDIEYRVRLFALSLLALTCVLFLGHCMFAPGEPKDVAADSITPEAADVVAAKEAKIHQLNGQLATTEPDNLNEQYRIYGVYSELADLDPTNKEYAAKKQASEALVREMRDKLTAQGRIATPRIDEEAQDQTLHPKKYVRLMDFSWDKGGFGTVMVASFTVANSLSYPIKDVRIECSLTAPSGTPLGQTSQVLYERIDAKQNRYFTDVNFGFIHTQSAVASCGIKDFEGR